MRLDAGEPPDAASERADRIILRAFALFRLTALAQIVFAVAAAWPRLSHPAASGLLAGVVVVESVVLVAGCWRRNRIPGVWVGADVLFTAVAVVVCAWVTSRPDFGTWANFMYGFSLVEVLIVGLGDVGPAGAVGYTIALATAYMVSAVIVHGDPVWNSLPNTVSYLANAGVSWLIARELRRSGRRLDEQRRLAVDQAAGLARTSEHARGARLLHDRVLQTLEMLAHPPWIGDLRMRSHVAAEASWLRDFVERLQHDGPDGLLEALQAVCDRHTRSGLQIEMNDTEVRAMAEGAPLSPEALAALAGALDEALVNVAKHACTSQATIRVGPSDGGITLSVLDQGVGFDPARPAPGFGVRNSILGRIRDAGGRARLESAPGRGTHIELWVPFASGS